ncbi:MAG: O-antigen ligase family protein [Verrucomicrobia bacterium]|nr:O-antigen ligase family protein [Verrucomicrobiota bacterium]
MNPRLRNSLIVALGVAIAMVAGWQIANESLIQAGALGTALALWLASRLCGISADALVAGLALAGYLIGNRGFAQLSVPNLPLLPGELTLGLGLCFIIWNAARTKELPVRRDALNAMLLTWLACGAIRFGYDVRVHGLMALRDFAILYYSLFFFLAQGWWADPDQRRWVQRCLTVGFAVGAPIFLAFARWPDFFVNNLSVRGVPLVYVKSDVQAGLLIAGTYWFLHRYVSSRRLGWLLLAATNLLGVLSANSRAALVAFGVTCLWLVACRDWRILRPIAALGAVGLAVLLTLPIVTQRPWKESIAYRFYESAASIGDTQGARSYETADLGDKPDNNRFRLTWWRIVVGETWSEGRWTGLGFGYDLSDQFLRIYYAESSEEFSTRSPHNYPLTVFARTGLIGVGLLLVCLAGITMRTWRAGRRAAQSDQPSEPFAMWVGTWGIFVSACFGVVLEGPMGAVVFWTLLGMANAAGSEPAPTSEPALPDPAPDLRDAPSAPQVAPSP